MIFSDTTSRATGFDREGTRLRGATVAWKGDGPELVKLFESESSALEEKLGHAFLVTLLPTSAVLVRSLSLKLVKEKEIDEVLEFQAEPLLPYPVESALLSRVILKKESDESELTLLAVQKTAVEEFLEEWKRLDIEPEILSCAPVALTAFSRLFSPTQQLHYHLHVGLEESCCLLVWEGKLLAAQSLVAADKQLPQQAARAALAMAKVAKGEPVLGVVITGQVTKELKLAVAEELKLPYLALQERAGFDEPLETLSHNALAIGAALAAKESVDFRKKEFTYPYPWKRLKQPISLFLFLAFALGCSLFFWSQSALERGAAELRQDYVTLLAELGQPNGEKHGLDSLTPKMIEERVEKLKKQVAAAPESFALLPDVPRVSDLLAWLASHPLVVGEGEVPRIELQQLHYKMVKRPELRRPQERYQVRVDLEFRSPLPLYARQFYEMLMSPNPLIDSNQEVKWSPTSEQQYRVSFFLKDRTRYPRG